MNPLSIYSAFAPNVMKYGLTRPTNLGFGYEKPDTYKRSSPKISRNSPCSCGSGLKYKKCCLK